MEKIAPAATRVTRSSQVTERLVAESRRPANLGAAQADVVSLAMGEPFADTPDVVVEAAIDALRRGRTRYAPQSGDPELQEGLAQMLERRRGARVRAEEVVLTHGASAGLAAVIMSVVDPGDRVVLPEPTYSLYADHVAMAGGVVDWIANSADGRLDLEALASALPGARAVIVCNPSNPTGRVIPPEDLLSLAKIANEHGVVLISDEAYADIVFDGVQFTSALGLDGGETICVGTFSKSYAMTGWRLGFVVADAARAADINRIHRTINGSINTFVQDAALAALSLPDDHFSGMVSAYAERRDYTVGRLAELPMVSMARPEGAFYAFPRIDSPRSAAELAALLADRGGVLVRAGSEYGPSGEGHLRLSFATDLSSLEEGLDRFADTLSAIVLADQRRSTINA